MNEFLRKAQRKLRLLGEINVLITSDAEMRRLNRKFRGKNRSTDVLSFLASRNGHSGIAGDIAISAEIARHNATGLGHEFQAELKILLLHGLLHLAGHDHQADNGEMAQLEQQLRTEFVLPTGLIARAKANATTTAVKSRARSRP